MKRPKSKMDKETNSRAYKMTRKRHICNVGGLCTICPMHGGENASRKGKHGVTKPRKKDKRG